MSGTSIFVCAEPRRSQWQLGALPPSIGRMMLIGWKKDPEPVDAGVPEGSMQGQVLLISAPAEAPPGIDRKQLRALLENEWGDAADALSAPGVIGVVRPGVDGDLAGLLTLTAGAERTSLAALEGETRRASFDWSVLTEDTFADRYGG